LHPDFGPRNPATVAHLESGLFLTTTGFPGHEVSLFDSASAKVSRFEVPGGGRLIASHAAAASGGRIAVTIASRRETDDESGASVLRLHDGQGRVLWEEPEPVVGGERTSDATSLVVSDDGRSAVIGRDDGSVSLWDLQARKRTVRWNDHRSRVREVAISPDGRHVASITSEGHLVVRGVGAGGRPALEWRSLGETLDSIEFCGNDAVVTCGWNRSGRLRWWWWDPEILRQKIAGMEPR
jgi:WD40 repeat protein